MMKTPLPLSEGNHETGSGSSIGGNAGPMISLGLISHSSKRRSADSALTAGSQVNCFRIYFRDRSFSSPGGMTVTKSSNDVWGIG
jgi:hypothetical protein